MAYEYERIFPLYYCQVINGTIKCNSHMYNFHNDDRHSIEEEEEWNGDGVSADHFKIWWLMLGKLLEKYEILK